MNALYRLLVCGAVCPLAALAQAQEGGHGVDARQGLDAQHHHHHHHPPQDQPLHEMFYSKWHMPDNPSASCCNEADCYPTEIKFVDGNIYAKRAGKTGSTFSFRPKRWSETETILMAGTIYAPHHPAHSAHRIPSTASRWEARHEIHLDQWQDTPPAIPLCVLPRADRDGLSARDRDAALLL